MANPYISALRRAIEQMKLQRAPVQQWLGTLQNAPGIRQSMLDDARMGLILREGRNSPVTRDELLQHLDDNAPQIDEIVYGGPREENVIQTEAASEDEYGHPLDEYGNRIWSRQDAVDDIMDEYSHELESLEERYRMNAYDDWYSNQEHFDRDSYRVQPYQPGLADRNYEPRLVEHDPAHTEDLFNPRGEIQGPPYRPRPYQVYGETIRAPDFIPSDGYFQRGDEIVREGDRAQWFIAQDRGDYTERELRDYYTGNFRQRGRLTADPLFEDPQLPDYAPTRVTDYSRRLNTPTGAGRGGYQSYRIDDAFDDPETAERILDTFDDRLSESTWEAFYDTPEEHAAMEDAREELIRRYIGQYTLDEDADQAVEVSTHVPYSDGRFVTPGGSDQFVILVNTKRNPLSREDYFEPHFKANEGGQMAGKNVFMHIRGNFRYDNEGNRVLFIDELQSKLHQKGYNEGYRASKPNADPNIPDGWRIIKGHELPQTQSYALRIKDNDWVLVNEGGGVVIHSDHHAIVDRTAQRYAEQFSTTKGSVPDFPLKGKEWLETGIRRILHWAAEHGVERIAWTTGDMQLERYAGVPVDIYDKIMPNIIGKFVKKNGGRVRLEQMNSAEGNTVWVADLPEATRERMLREGVTYGAAGLAAGLAAQSRRHDNRQRRDPII